MQIKTSYAGDVNYEDKDIIKLDKGLYGFPASKSFIRIGDFTAEFPFAWLQSLDEEEVHFIVTNPFLFVASYDFELDDDLVERIGVTDASQLEILTTVNIPFDIDQTTTNLKSPLIINKATKQAEQAILNEDYPYKYVLFAKGD